MKTKTRLVTLFNVLIVFAISGCIEDDTTKSCSPDTGPKEVSLMTLQDLEGPIDCSLKDLSEENNYVIQKQSTFDDLIDCQGVSIDLNFENNTVLIGSFLTPNSGSVLSQSVFEDCQNQKYIYEVTISDGNFTTPTWVEFHAVVPKLPKGYIVDFNVQLE